MSGTMAYSVLFCLRGFCCEFHRQAYTCGDRQAKRVPTEVLFDDFLASIFVSSRLRRHRSIYDLRFYYGGSNLLLKCAKIFCISLWVNEKMRRYIFILE